MQKYLLYQKGLRIADLEQSDVKPDARRAFSEWVEHSRLVLRETKEREACTFRFVEMRGYRQGYEGTCYWISFSAHRPYVKKEGHSPRRTHVNLWVYWDHEQWKGLPFGTTTFEEAFSILLQSWKREEQPVHIPTLKEEGSTTTDDIYVDVLQRLQQAHVRLGASLTYEEAEHIEEDEEGNDLYVPAGDVQVWFKIEDEIKLYAGNTIILPHPAFHIEDMEEIGFEIEEQSPSPFDVSLSMKERMEQTTNVETLCSLINELADMGCEVTIKQESKDGAPYVRVLDVEYLNNKNGLDDIERLLSRGKYRIHYLPLRDDGFLDPYEVKTTELPTSMSFWVWYNREAVRYRVHHRKEDALTFYQTDFLPKVRAARTHDEIPSFVF